MVAVWPRGNNVAHTNSHSMLNLVSSAIGDHSHVYCSGISVTSHPGQLSLIPSAEWQISASQGAVAVFVGWEDNHRSGITLAICHRLWHPANTPVWVLHLLSFQVKITNQIEATVDITIHSSAAPW